MKKTTCILIVGAMVCAGCSLEKAGPAVPAGFVEPAFMSQSSGLPFQRSWRKIGFDFNQYDKIYVAPINTDYLKKPDWWDKVEREEEFKNDIKDLAYFTRITFMDSFRNDSARKYKVVGRSGNKTLTFEFALTEVVPNKAVVEALMFAGSLATGFAGTVAGAALTTQTESTVAFEARFRDGLTGEIVAAFADREAEKKSIINVKGLTWYAHARSIIEEWAGQFVQVVNQKPGQIIKDSKSYEIKPW